MLSHPCTTSGTTINPRKFCRPFDIPPILSYSSHRVLSETPPCVDPLSTIWVIHTYSIRICTHMLSYAFICTSYALIWTNRFTTRLHMYPYVLHMSTYVSHMHPYVIHMYSYEWHVYSYGSISTHLSILSLRMGTQGVMGGGRASCRFLWYPCPTLEVQSQFHHHFRAFSAMTVVSLFPLLLQ